MEGRELLHNRATAGRNGRGGFVIEHTLVYFELRHLKQECVALGRRGVVSRAGGSTVAASQEQESLTGSIG